MIALGSGDSNASRMAGRRAIESATPRPVTPIYTELSEILQIELHRALVGQAQPQAALDDAAAKINTLIDRTGMRKLMSASTQ